MKTPIKNGILQSDLDVAGYDLLNFSGGGGGGGGRDILKLADGLLTFPVVGPDRM